MNTERIQFDYFIDEDSELAPPQEMIDRGGALFCRAVHPARGRAGACADGAVSAKIIMPLCTRI